MRWGPDDDPFFVAHDGVHIEGSGCEVVPPCMFVVEQHQFPKGPEVPEFTISLKWQPGESIGGFYEKVSDFRGWRWILRWTDPATGKTEVRSGYGLATEQMARSAAEEKAVEIVKSQQPETVYKFIPPEV